MRTDEGFIASGATLFKHVHAGSVIIPLPPLTCFFLPVQIRITMKTKPACPVCDSAVHVRTLGGGTPGMYRYTCDADDTRWQEKPPHQLLKHESRRVVMKKPRRSRAKTESYREDNVNIVVSSVLDEGNPQPDLALFIAPMPFAEHFASVATSALFDTEKGIVAQHGASSGSCCNALL